MVNMTSIVDAVMTSMRQYIDSIQMHDPTAYGKYLGVDLNDPAYFLVEVQGREIGGVVLMSHVTGLVSGDIVELLYGRANKRPTIFGRIP